jgi:hypothetical protein
VQMFLQLGGAEGEVREVCLAHRATPH